MLRVGRRGTRFTARFEGFRSCPYKIGDDPWTIGYGTTSGSGRDVGPNTPCITERTGRRWLRRDLNRRYLPTIPRRWRMRQREIDALSSLAYNGGPRIVSDPSYSTLARRLKSKEGRRYKRRKRIYRQELPRWVNPGTQFEAGLRKRREAEVRLANRGDYSGSP